MNTYTQSIFHNSFDVSLSSTKFSTTGIVSHFPSDVFRRPNASLKGIPFGPLVVPQVASGSRPDVVRDAAPGHVHHIHGRVVQSTALVQTHIPLEVHNYILHLGRSHFNMGIHFGHIPVSVEISLESIDKVYQQFTISMSMSSMGEFSITIASVELWTAFGKYMPSNSNIWSSLAVNPFITTLNKKAFLNQIFAIFIRRDERAIVESRDERTAANRFKQSKPDCRRGKRYPHRVIHFSLKTTECHSM